MKRNKICGTVSQYIVIVLAFLLMSCQTDAPKNSIFKLWYQQAATKWTEALPIGNGRLGAMVYGGIYNQTLNN